MLEPPAPGVYPTADALVQATNLHTRGQGYAIIKQRTKEKGGELHQLYLCCDRGGEYHNYANEFIGTFLGRLFSEDWVPFLPCWNAQGGAVVPGHMKAVVDRVILLLTTQVMELSTIGT